WVAEHIQGVGDAVAVDASSRYALLALQCPEAQKILQPLTGVDLAAIKYYWFAHGEVASVRATISRTGYTGEDGFEIFVPPLSADRVWPALLAAGEAGGPGPWGLGARRSRRRATRCGSKRACASTATTSTRRRLRWKRI